MKQANRIVQKVKGKYWKTAHKFGIEIPHSVKEALAIYAKNGNHLWRDSI